MSECVTIGGCTLYLGDCLEVLAGIEGVDSCVTDPPYGLSFMGKRWDYDVPSVAIWEQCLRALKPGGHLLAFAGTRTQHRMACRIEDAGFEIRDMIAWCYATGFPKSLDVSKAIDKADGYWRGKAGDVITENKSMSGGNYARTPKGEPITAAAAAWKGWGTALKPAIETVTFASKPYTQQHDQGIILSDLIRLEARLWLLSSASAAEKSSASSQSEYVAACDIAQWSAEKITNTQAALCGQMDTSRFESATITSLNIVSSWRRTLDANWNDGSMSTIETRSNTTIDWRTLKFSLSQITPSTIIKACSLPGGFNANASTAESHFNASLSLLQNIRTLSATEPAMSLGAESCRGADVKPNLDPCIMARKPIVGTVAANVLEHGTGALNIDGARVGDEQIKTCAKRKGDSFTSVGNSAGFNGCEESFHEGRWPANFIHDGSDEATDRLGEAARFFYCAKASKRDRDEGLEGMPEVLAMRYGEKAQGPLPQQTPSKPVAQRNFHPTVKPTDLMRYLCRLVTRPGGVVLDPFMGSGSTGKAAVAEGFRFIGIERDPAYFEIACNRIRAAHEKANQAEVHADLFQETA